MVQLLTANSATNLYWLGRYIERINGLLINLMPAYDKTIDIDTNAGKVLYESFQIDIEYESAHQFLEAAMFGDHDSNLATLSEYARENAIICRSYVNTEAFGEIIELNAMLKNAANSYADIDYKLINDALSLISEIWGEVSKVSKSNTSDHFLKLGRLIEKLDFHLRFNAPDEHSANLAESIQGITEFIASQDKEQTSQSQTLSQADKTDAQNIIDAMHAKVESLIIH